MENKEIALKLEPSERTVKAYRDQVMEKLNVASIADLLSLAEKLKILTSER